MGSKRRVLKRSFAALPKAPLLAALLGAGILLSACVSPPQKDYTAFRESRPYSILIMPPVNLSPDMKAAPTFLSASIRPLAEAGYYVIPVSLSSETFRQNGISAAEEAQAIRPERLREIFGADAALYLTITRFGASYALIDSVVAAAASARLVDLRNGREIWSGSANVSEGSTNASGDLFGMLLTAAASQILNTISDRAYTAGRRAAGELLSAGKTGGVLYGPYNPNYGTD